MQKSFKVRLHREKRSESSKEPDKVLVEGTIVTSGGSEGNKGKLVICLARAGLKKTPTKLQ